MDQLAKVFAPSLGFLILSTLAMLIGLAVTRWIHSHTQMEISVPPANFPPLTPSPYLSAIVPARNEARNIRRCIETLLAQTYPQYEVIVVDDRSTDATPQILQELALTHPNLRVLRGEDLPPGWTGKPHALCQGAGAARGEWLCFVDADTFLRPQALSSTLQKAEELHADLFTILTDQELGTFWERAILPIVFTALSVGFPASRVNDPSRPEAIANGQFILIRKMVYEAIGGHEAVKDRIDEDKGLAEVVKRSGYRLIVADGRELASTRMYTSLPEMWEGWTKNIFVGMRDRLGLLLFGAVLCLVGALLLPAWLAGSLLWVIYTGGWIPALIAIEALAVWYDLIRVRMQAAQAFRISPLYAFTLPLGALVFTGMMFASAFKVLSRKGVTWRGRTYQP